MSPGTCYLTTKRSFDLLPTLTVACEQVGRKVRSPVGGASWRYGVVTVAHVACHHNGEQVLQWAVSAQARQDFWMVADAPCAANGLSRTGAGVLAAAAQLQRRKVGMIFVTLVWLGAGVAERGAGNGAGLARAAPDPLVRGRGQRPDAAHPAGPGRGAGPGPADPP